MNRMIAIMQPTYMPWLGYFSMIDEVDEFVFLDNVQLVLRSWQVRNKIKLNDQEKLLTIPIDHAVDRDHRMINLTRYVENSWKQKHLETIRQAYKYTEYFDEVYTFLCEKYREDYVSVGDFNIQMIVGISEKIGITTQFVRASEIGGTGIKDALLTDICKKMKADAYLSAQGSAAYIETKSPGGEFVRQGIDLFYQNYNHPKYRQQGAVFISHIGVYDLLFNAGFKNALEIIREGQRKAYVYSEFGKNCGI